ncbi:MAG: zinc-finger-containing protein [Bacillota bacterium]|nr:zinc-finger-containing protein [Bacillota bacterium]
MDCPYCGKTALFMSSKDFYGKDFGSNMYVCKSCDAYVGTHGNSKAPLGTMANAQLRSLRKAAHSLFDPLWKGRKMSRDGAYRWLQDNMNLPADKAHIGMLNDDQCKELIQKLKTYRFGAN